LESQLNCLGLKIKKGMIQDATFIYLDSGHAKVDKSRKNEAKTGRNWEGTEKKRVLNQTLDINFMPFNRRDYELIRRFKITTASLII